MVSTFAAAKTLKKIASLLELTSADASLIKNCKTAEVIVKRKNESLTSALPKIDRTLSPQVRNILQQIAESKTPDLLIELERTVPLGLQDLLKIRGLGPKKILHLSQVHSINSPIDLLRIIENESILKIKGFAKNSVESLNANLQFYFLSKNHIKLDEHEDVVSEVLEAIASAELDVVITPCGLSQVKEEVFTRVEFLIERADLSKVLKVISELGFIETSNSAEDLLVVQKNNIIIHLNISTENDFCKDLFVRSCSEEYLSYLQTLKNFVSAIENFSDEATFYSDLKLGFDPPEFRHTLALNKPKKRLIQDKDLRGIIHTHTIYSDGLNSIQEMAIAASETGSEYILISDHSVSAIYANGLNVERIKRQHIEIENLNLYSENFHIFKGIEADILKDGSLDYDSETLNSFDFVIASVHSNFELNVDEMTSRILKALENPYSRMLAHPTGRILLGRPGYQINLEKILLSAKNNSKIIELNANPKRLDLNWRDLGLAKEMGLKFAISPDAHSVDQINFTKYGILMGRKAGLTAEDVINCLSKEEFETTLCNKKQP